MTLKSAKRITGLDIQVVAEAKDFFVYALDGDRVVAKVSGRNLKTLLSLAVEQVYALNRQIALERAEWKYQICGSRSGLQCHHKIHRSMGRRDDRPTNLQVLCLQCHERHHHGK